LPALSDKPFEHAPARLRGRIFDWFPWKGTNRPPDTAYAFQAGEPIVEPALFIHAVEARDGSAAVQDNEGFSGPYLLQVAVEVAS
jgi:hypothetical protein